MHSEIHEFKYENGDIQRVQLVRFSDWEKLQFLPMEPTAQAFACFTNIYARHLVPTLPLAFGQMALFTKPDAKEEEITDIAKVLAKGLKIRKGKAHFKRLEAHKRWKELSCAEQVAIICGKMPFTKVIPVSNKSGFLSEIKPEAALKVNASFFIMDPFDCATVYDHIGTPVGLCVKDGVVLSPSLFGREALLVRKNNSVSVVGMDVTDLQPEINGVRYNLGAGEGGQQAKVYTRPAYSKTPAGKGLRIVIVGNRVVDVIDGGVVPVPGAGFVLCLEKKNGRSERSDIHRGDEVIYHGLEDVIFGIQVGNSVMRNGVKTEGFISRFYDIYKFEKVPYPPCLYPMDFEKGRAARMVLGADADGKPMLLWAEGAAKFGYEPGKGSCGASLSELGTICEKLGFANAINLDGGGSAQILYHNKRELLISDRTGEDYREVERPIPLGLMVE